MSANGVMKLEDHVYDWDNIVVGGDLRSLLYAVENNHTLIFTRPVPPFRFDTLSQDIDVTKLGFRKGSQISDLEAWERAFLYVGLIGLCPLSSRAENIRVKGHSLVITTKNQRVIKAKFKKLIIFDDTQLKNLPDVRKQEKEHNKVIDWFNVRYGCRHNWEYLYGDDEFISSIHFYPTDRSDNKTLKDAVTISLLSDEQLEDIDFSEYMAKFKVEDMMKQAGIKGPINGYKQGKPIYRNIKIEHADREVVRSTKRYYKADPRYNFRYDSLEDIFNNFQTPDAMKKLFRIQ